MTNTTHTQKTFNWESARQQAAEIKSTLDLISNPPREALARVWAENARNLAKVPFQEQTGERINLVFVRLGEGTFAINVAYVNDILPAAQITLVPNTPEWVCGVYNLRGHILSVVDLTRFLNLPASDREGEEADKASLVVVRTAEMECALLVNHVLAVGEVPTVLVHPSSEVIRGLSPEFVDGIVELYCEEGHFTATYLNFDAVMVDERLVINQAKL